MAGEIIVNHGCNGEINRGVHWRRDTHTLGPSRRELYRAAAARSADGKAETGNNLASSSAKPTKAPVGRGSNKG